jgi:uncharacterized membrane protein YbhN (UPF0104 family)
MRRRAHMVLRGLPLCLLAVVLWREKPWAIHFAARASWAIAAAVLLNFGVSLPLKAARWRVALMKPPAFRDALAATLEGLLAGAAIGFGSGDLVRAARLPRDGRELATDYACTSAERGAEAFALALMVFATALVADLGSVVVMLSGLGVVAYLALLGFGRVLVPKLSGWPRVHRLLWSALQASTPRKVAAIVALSLLGWAVEVAMLLMFQSAFRLEPSIRTAVLTLVGINAAIAIPVAPGNFGTFEAGAALALVASGAPRDVALSLALTYHLTHVVPVALVATAVYLVRSYRPTPAGLSINR